MKLNNATFMPCLFPKDFFFFFKFTITQETPNAYWNVFTVMNELLADQAIQCQLGMNTTHITFQGK